MDYIPLYRKWRSQNFDEIVGQDFIVQTLQNAIKSSRISHAYLFSGPRGTGKTSTARIFAKALNCKEGPTPSPCGKCDNCIKIKNGHAVDVIEIDAASNRGIDEIRDLREKVRYAPVEGKYKVYIIDEVHMLTSEAFNALLKTLEEPPQNVIFILATTEPQKVPLTIASRCQRLDFKRLADKNVVEQIKMIAREEGVTIEDAAVSMIARNCEGAMRDAISLLDQLVSFSGKKISHDDVVKVLGTASVDMVFDFADGLAKSNIGELFESVNKMVSEGRSIQQATKELIMHLRNLLLVRLGSEEVIEESNDHIERLKAQAKLFTLDGLKDAIKALSKAEADMKWHPQARIILEMAVFEACTPKNTVLFQSAIVPQKHEVKAVSRPEPETERPVATSVKPATSGPLTISEIKSKWESVLSEVKKKNAFAYISLHEGQPDALNSDQLTINFKKGFAFHKARLEELSNKEIVEGILNSVFGRKISINCIISAEIPSQVISPSSASKVAEIFGGQIIS